MSDPKDVTTRRSGKALREASALEMLREVVRTFTDVEIESARAKPGDSTVGFMRAYMRFERTIRRVREAMPPENLREPATGPGHWLGCSLPDDHDGDCLVPRGRR
jgi:hypothetical protein